VGNPARQATIQPPPPDGFWKRVWKNIEPAVGALVEDAILLVIFILVLSLAYLVLGILAGLGYPASRIETLETIHYYAYLVVFSTFMVDLVMRILLHTFRKR
jgi:hypothetical protein